MTNDDDKPEVVVAYRLPRWAVLLIAGMFFISTGTSAVALVTVLHAGGEHARECEVATKAIDLALVGLVDQPQRSDLPRRTASDDKQREEYFAALIAGVNKSLEKC